MKKSALLNAAHAGTLVVDRYAAYGSTWTGPVQYCLEHDKRNVRDLLEAEPENEEYGRLVPPFLSLLAEAMTLRRIRPLVIARKVSFGSQSEKGLKTRETLTSVVCSLALRCDDPVARLASVFDALARTGT